jgi:hypothetical protein
MVRRLYLAGLEALTARRADDSPDRLGACQRICPTASSAQIEGDGKVEEKDVDVVYIGCGPTIACGSILSAPVAGRTIEDCREQIAEELIEALDDVPPGKYDDALCAYVKPKGDLRSAGGRGRETRAQRRKAVAKPDAQRPAPSDSHSDRATLSLDQIVSIIFSSTSFDGRNCSSAKSANGVGVVFCMLTKSLRFEST